jgi:putative YphP/YqiW family bacilliredoxin
MARIPAAPEAFLRFEMHAAWRTVPTALRRPMDLNARFIQPMRDELTSIGFTELTTPEAVDAALGTREGATLVFVNSVCGCAAGMARPGMAQALGSTAARPDRLVTVFAGQDRDATARARSYFGDQPPSSPSIALLKDGKTVAFVPRHHIEGRDASMVAEMVRTALEAHCGAART